MTKKPEDLRSYRWFGGERTAGLRAFGHRSRMRQLGVEPAEHLGKPLIAILNTWSELNPCHMHLRQRAEQVKRGVLEAGGFPVEMPVATLSETFQKPTPMMYRNLLAMETEELLRSYPADGAVLMGGCDKTTPALLMGAASANIPAIYLTAGPMLRGNFRGQSVGSGTDVWKFWDDARAGLIGDCELADLEGGIARSPGHCMTMGTASTMTSAAEALGMTLPGMASVPAVDSAHYRMAAATGRRIVAMVWEDLSPDQILTREAFEDAVATVLALGGSTNALIHLIAMAGRAGVELTLDDFDAISRRVPWLANIKPSGQYLMEDFYYAGGLPALLGQLAKVPGTLHLDRITVTGGPFGPGILEAPVHNSDVIRTPETALAAEGGVAVLRGNLAPDGAVIKHIAAEPRLLKHTGPAVVFDSYRDLQLRINDPALNITPDSVLVLRNAGPKGGPGMPEYGMLPIPDYLLVRGVRDMVRISDARMSGTSYGACVLHVAPESFVGGPLALVQTGDLITLDVAARELSLNISERAMARRGEQWQPPEPKFERGYGALYTEHITQANEGCDFGFLARRGRNPEPDPQLFSPKPTQSFPQAHPIFPPSPPNLSPKPTLGATMIQGFDPRTGEPEGEPVPETTGAEVDALVAAAHAAALAWGAWSATLRRADALEAVADALDARAGELAVIADTETGLGGERLTGEVARATGQLRLFAVVLRDGGYAEAVISPAAGVTPDIRRITRPVGPVAVFAASNFPFAFSVAGGDTASALAAGCPVVVKAHEGHPVTSGLTAEIVTGALTAAGAPAGTFGLVHGVQAGLQLLRHPLIAAAGFTGSTAGGLALARVCAERPVPIPFYGELGSVNPCVVLPGAAFSRPAAIAAGYVASLTLGTGQFCTNPGLLFVPEDVGLLTAIGEEVGASSGAPMLSGRIFAGYQDAVEEVVAHPGLTELASGTPGHGPWGATPRVFQVTLKEFAADLAVLARERFGPAGLVISYPSVADLLPVLAALPGNLVGTVHADTDSPEDMDLARQAVAVLEHVAGRIVFNGWPTGVAVVAAQHHGGPWPTTTVPAYTSVGTAAIRRWLVPVAYQNFPVELLPPGLR